MLKTITVAAVFAFGAVTAASAVEDAYSAAEYGIATQYHGKMSHLDNVFASRSGTHARQGFTSAEMREFQDPYSDAQHNLWPRQVR